jgi:hypothetical protein
MNNLLALEKVYPSDLSAALCRSWSENVSGLAAALFEHPPNAWNVAALVPPNTPEERLLEFDRGGLTTRSESMNWLYSHIKKLSDIAGGGTFVVQDIGISVDVRTPIMTANSAKYFGYGDSTFYWEDTSFFGTEDMDKVLRAVRSFPCIAAFTTIDLTRFRISNSETLSRSAFDEIQHNINEYYISAYDEESYVVVNVK